MIIKGMHYSENCECEGCKRVSGKPKKIGGTSKITQALAEDRERVRKKIEKLQNDGLNVIIEGDYYVNFRDVENILSSLDKQLTDNE